MPGVDRHAFLRRWFTTAAASAVVLALGAVTSSAQTATPTGSRGADNGQIDFTMPSGNIGCTFTPAGGTSVYKPFDGGPELSCDRIRPKYVRVVLTPKAVRRFDDVGDQDCCSAGNTFAYGNHWSRGPFSCESSEQGLTCRLGDGRGFSMSTATVRTF